MAEKAAPSFPLRQLFQTVNTVFLCLLVATVSEAGSSPNLMIKGAGKSEEKNIRDYLQVAKLSCELPDWRVATLTKSLGKDIRKALRAVGYYHPELKLEIRPDDKCFEIQLEVIQGIGVMVQKVDIQVSEAMDELPAYREFRDNLPNSEGQLLEHRLYDKTRHRIEALASRFGFFDGEFNTRKLEVNTDTNNARFILDYNAGERYRLGEITIENTQFNDELMDQFIQLKTGDFYDSRALIQQQKAFSDSAFFQNVEVITLREERNPQSQTVPIQIKLKKRKRSLHQFGIGASTDVGPRLSYSLDRRWVNDKGHTFGWDTSLSPATRNLTTRYGIPKGDAGKSRVDLQTGYLYEKSDSNETATFKMAATQTEIIGENWGRSYSLEYLTETYTTSGEEDVSEMLLPGIRWYKMRADNHLFPRDGWRLNARIRTALDAMLSDTDLFQVTLSFKSITPAGRGRLIGRIDAGISSVSEFDRLPASLRFFAGGDGTIRGYNYEELGPTDADGDVIGGRHLLVVSVEYEHPITDRWGVAIFVDYGNAFNDIKDTDFFRGAGIGARWHSPLGPIRLDIAQGIDAGSSTQLHLSMGTDL